METLAKAFKIIGGVNTFIGDTLDYIGDTLDCILLIYKFNEKFETFIYKFGKKFEKFTYEYLHEHPDENAYTEIKCSNPSFSIIIEGKEIFNYRTKILAAFIINNEKMTNDHKIDFEAIVKKRLQSVEDEFLYRNTTLRPEEEHN